MRPHPVCALVGIVLSCSLAAAEPDFEDFLALIDTSLIESGAGGFPGERIEIHRIADSGWEIQIIAAWDGTHWRLLALRLHHPERIEAADERWLTRYELLLATLRAEDLEALEEPELFEVPAPAFLPAWPEELRARQFSIGSFWYQARWFNDGGLDEDARWALRSFELVARPPVRQ
ncbi:MAG: hypothetical protein EA419_01725 [Wenzhouxiangella sp.]|nr:MAG: hypothetical protein EA419_01725 [Wenzhouxiangella sp.]